MNKKNDLHQRLKELFPRASREELERKAEAQRRRVEQLRKDILDLEAELAAQRKNRGTPPWPGALEPVVLAATFITRGGDVDRIAEKVTELSSRPYALPAIRSTVYRLVRSGLLSENDRTFSVTPQGERELAHARDDAKRWVDALGNQLSGEADT
jgi:hypothetical protein